jgi:hypothetical protein
VNDGWTTFRFEGPAVDVSNRAAVEAKLRSVSASGARLALDWNDVVYVDLLGLEAVFDVVIDHPQAVAFVGMNRSLKHLLLRLQLLPVVPTFDDVEAAAAAFGASP